MTLLRRPDDPVDAVRAARRLAGVARLPTSDRPPVDPDDPYDGPSDDTDGFDWFAPAPDRAPGAAPPPGGGGLLGGAVRRGGVPLGAAAAVVLVVAAVVAGVLLRAGTSRPQVVDVGSRSAPATAAAEAPPSELFVGAVSSPVPRTATGAVPTDGATAAAPVVVDVVGKVRRPGLVRLPAGSRVADAIAAAGGPTDRAVLPRINLARLLADGEQVVVPDADDPVPSAPPALAATPGVTGPAAGPLDLNSATAADLDGLPGVGPVIAGRIVAWRAEHQRFTRVDELAEVAGIGDRMLERLRPLVRV